MEEYTICNKYVLKKNSTPNEKFFKNIHGAVGKNKYS